VAFISGAAPSATAGLSVLSGQVTGVCGEAILSVVGALPGRAPPAFEQAERNAARLGVATAARAAPA